MAKIIRFSIIFLLFFQFMGAQEHPGAELGSKSEHHGYNYAHGISLFISHTQIREAVHNDKQWISLPSFSLNYDFILSKKWAIGLHNDFIFEEFIIGKKVEGEEEVEDIERSYPVSSAVMLSYFPIKHLILAVGGGMEFSKAENFPVIRFAVESPFHINESWEVVGLFSYDININAYDSYTFGLGIGYLF